MPYVFLYYLITGTHPGCVRPWTNIICWTLTCMRKRWLKCFIKFMRTDEIYWSFQQCFKWEGKNYLYSCLLSFECTWKFLAINEDLPNWLVNPILVVLYYVIPWRKCIALCRSDLIILPELRFYLTDLVVLVTELQRHLVNTTYSIVRQRVPEKGKEGARIHRGPRSSGASSRWHCLSRWVYTPNWDL